MNIVSAFTLAATLILAGDLHAQACSGGPDGGTDASGNQCSEPAAGVTSVAAFDRMPALSTARPGSVLQLTLVVMRPGPQAATPGEPVLQKRTAEHKARTAAAPMAAIEPMTVSSIAAPDSTSCSGGAGGGMDATGNQCSDTALFAQNARASKVPRQ